MFFNLVLVLVPCVLRIQGEPTTINNNNYNSTDLSYLSKGIQIPADAQVNDPDQGTEELSIADMKWFSGLYDQHQWLGRVLTLESKDCEENMEVYIRQLHNGSLWAAKSK